MNTTGRRHLSFPIDLFTAVRIAGLVVGLFLFIGGVRSTLHPSFNVAYRRAEPAEPGMVPVFRAELTTSKTSRAFGIVRVLLGVWLTAYILRQFWTARARRLGSSIEADPASGHEQQPGQSNANQ